MSAIVDAHVHVWGRELLDASWLQDPAADILRRPFTLDELWPAARSGGVDRVVLVAADETLSGTRLLVERACHDARVGAVVGWIELVEPGAVDELAALRAHPGGSLLRGIRQPTAGRPAEWWDALAASDATAELERLGLVLELLVAAVDLPRVGALAARRPALTVVVDHLGHPPSPLDADWGESLAGLAPSPGVALKVSGIEFDDDGFRVVVERARAELGADRLLAGSDWPVVLRRTRVDAEWRRLHRVAEAWQPAERDALLGGSASRVYGIAT